jgi:AAA domain
MKIIKLHAENLKRLKVVDITPTEHVIELSGTNGSGKSSVLDAIWWTLGSGRTITSQPIRHGESNAYVEIDLGDLVVKRTFRRKDETDFTTSITVSTKDGAKYGNPQEVLNNLIGRLTFDPLDFARLNQAEQVKLLRSLVTDFDFAAAEKANADDFAERRLTNQRIKEVEAELATMTRPDAPLEPIDIASLTEEMKAANRANEDRAFAIAKQERFERQCEDAKNKVSMLRARLAEAEDELETISQTMVEAQIIVPERVDVDAIQSRIDDARLSNLAYEREQHRLGLVSRLGTLEDKSASLTASMTTRKEQATQAVRDAQIPVEGLEATETGILIKGIPFDQISDAERLRASIAIAAALNPKLRVLRVRDGSLLDSTSMALLKEFAVEHDMQIWMEVVTDGEPRGVVIEDGEVAHV